MDTIKQLGELAIASRLKRLADRLSQDVSQIYKANALDFEPRWFPVYYVLSKQSPIGICDIATELGVSHPLVNQIADELIRHGLAEAQKDPGDKRKRLLALSERGQELLPAQESLWKEIEWAARDWLLSSGYDVLAIVDSLEQALDARSFYTRYDEIHRQGHREAIDIIGFSPEYRHYFKTLNEEWICQYFVLEPDDERILSNPEAEILNPGGAILFARYHGEIVGTCALKPVESGVLELAKMAVTEAMRGKQIGRELMKAAIEKARSMGAHTLVLETNSSLTTAIALYRKFGFRLVPHTEHQPQYQRGDMMMKLSLSPVEYTGIPVGESREAALS